MFPGDALPLILFLFLLQHQLDEKLLQLFITVVDAELFKATEQETQENECHVTDATTCINNYIQR